MIYFFRRSTDGARVLVGDWDELEKLGDTINVLRKQQAATAAEHVVDFDDNGETERLVVRVVYG